MSGMCLFLIQRMAGQCCETCVPVGALQSAGAHGDEFSAKEKGAGGAFFTLCFDVLIVNKWI